MLYYPWHDERDLIASDQTCTSKFYEPGVQDIIERNKAIFEPDSDAITEALEELNSYDAINDQENADLLCKLESDSYQDESFHEKSPSHLHSTQMSEQTSLRTICFHNQPTDIPDDILREIVRSLNVQQRNAYNTFLSWCCNTMENLNSLKPTAIDPIFLFITGGGGAGKSFDQNNISYCC